MVILAELCVFLIMLVWAAYARAERIHFDQGYHGGYFLRDKRENEDAFRVLFDLLAQYPRYRISMEYEPYTLERMESGAKFASEIGKWSSSESEDTDGELMSFRSPEILAELRKLVHEGRIEIVGGTYTQPLWSAGDGESWIRQFLLGCDAVKKTLGVDVKTYAVQEDCVISQLPQILLGFGFTGYIFRVPWAPWGNPPQMNAEKIILVGPDGSQIDAVPRYAFDRNSNFRWPVSLSLKFIENARQAGIEEPYFSDQEDFIPHFIRYDPNFLTSGQLPCWAALGQPMDAELYRGKELLFSGHIKTRHNRARLYIDARAEHLIPGISAYAKPDGEWERLKITYKVPENAVIIFPQVRLDGALGEAWFDNLSLKVCNTDRELLKNGSFEVVGADGRPDGWQLWQGDQGGVPMELSGEDAHVGDRSVILKVMGKTLDVNFTTSGAYIKDTPAPQKVWRDPYSESEFRWPWGFRAGELQKQCRETQRQVEVAERLGILSGSDHSERIRDAWELLLMAKHHDTQSCFPSKFGIWRGPEKDYGELGYSWTGQSKEISGQVIAQVGEELLSPGLGLTVFNTLARGREMLVEKAVRLPQSKGWKNVHIRDSKGQVVPCDVSVGSYYDDGSIRDVLLNFSANAPAMGYRSYNLAEGAAEIVSDMKIERRQDEIFVENEFYRLRIAGGKGLNSIFDKRLKREVLAEAAYFAGYFPDVSKELRSVVESLDLENGSLRTVVILKGYIGEVPLEQRIILYQTSPIVETEVSFDFGEGLRIGSDSGEVFEGTTLRSDWADDSRKLRFVLPVAPEMFRAYCDHQYDVRQAPKNPYWGVSWADLEGEDSGVALLFDRISSFLWGKDRLELVLGYGGHFMFGPDRTTLLAGKHSYRFGIASFAGDWETVALPSLAEDFARPLFCLEGITRLEEHTSFWLEPADSVLLGTAYRDRDGLIVRLFNPYTDSRSVALVVPGLKSAQETGMAGRNGRSLLTEESRIGLGLSPKQILTLRLEVESVRR